MEFLTMTNKQRSDFEGRFFDLLNETVSDIKDSIKDLKGDVQSNTRITQQIHEQAKATNGRVTALEKEVFHAVQAKDLASSFWKDPKVLQIAVYLSLAILLLVAAWVRFDIEKIL